MSCENTNSVFINASHEIKELIFKISKSTIKKEKMKAFFSYWTFTCVLITPRTKLLVLVFQIFLLVLVVRFWFPELIYTICSRHTYPLIGGMFGEMLTTRTKFSDGKPNPEVLKKKGTRKVWNKGELFLVVLPRYFHITFHPTGFFHRK